MHKPGTIVTKGIASVRSPVCNLQQFRPNLNHDAFSAAVVNEFRNEYDVDEMVRIFLFSYHIVFENFQVHVVEENEDTTTMEYIRQGMTELLVYTLHFYKLTQ
jgi:lipoate---protein ligase